MTDLTIIEPATSIEEMEAALAALDWEPIEEPDLGPLDYNPSLLPDETADWSDHPTTDDREPLAGVAGLASSPTVWMRGRAACSCMEQVIPIVEEKLRALGAIKRDLSGLITQGAWNGTNVSASAGTHAGGGVWDVAHWLVDTDAKKRAWLAGGIIPFDRRTIDANWPNHGHVVTAGCPHLDWSAAMQVTSARNGRNGLRGDGPFRGLGGAPEIITWQTAVNRYNEETQMKTTDVVGKDKDGKPITVGQALSRGAYAYERIMNDKVTDYDDKTITVGQALSRGAYAYGAIFERGFLGKALKDLRDRVAKLEGRR